MSQEAATAQFQASFGECIHPNYCDFGSEVDSSAAWGLVTFGLLVITFGFCALRTNMIFVFCFAVVSNAVFLMAGSYWALAAGRNHLAESMQKVRSKSKSCGEPAADASFPGHRCDILLLLCPGLVPPRCQSAGGT